MKLKVRNVILSLMNSVCLFFIIIKMLTNTMPKIYYLIWANKIPKLLFALKWMLSIALNKSNASVIKIDLFNNHSIIVDCHLIHQLIDFLEFFAQVKAQFKLWLIIFKAGVIKAILISKPAQRKRNKAGLIWEVYWIL